jgi:hypothetical protein
VHAIAVPVPQRDFLQGNQWMTLEGLHKPKASACTFCLKNNQFDIEVKI